MANNSHNNRLARDGAVIAVSIGLAVYLGVSGNIGRLVEFSTDLHWLESFLGGMFFTSAFTTAPAIVLLGNIAQKGSAIDTAFFGALGALVGDMVIFQFFRSTISADLLALIGRHERERVRHIFHLRLFRWFTPFIGALIVASPLPDELALVLMGLSKTNTRTVMTFSFIANFIGIGLIALAAKALQ